MLYLEELRNKRKNELVFLVKIKTKLYEEN